HGPRQRRDRRPRGRRLVTDEPTFFGAYPDHRVGSGRFPSGGAGDRHGLPEAADRSDVAFIFPVRYIFISLGRLPPHPDSPLPSGSTPCSAPTASPALPSWLPSCQSSPR